MRSWHSFSTALMLFNSFFMGGVARNMVLDYSPRRKGREVDLPARREWQVRLGQQYVSSAGPGPSALSRLRPANRHVPQSLTHVCPCNSACLASVS